MYSLNKTDDISNVKSKIKKAVKINRSNAIVWDENMPQRVKYICPIIAFANKIYNRVVTKLHYVYVFMKADYKKFIYVRFELCVDVIPIAKKSLKIPKG